MLCYIYELLPIPILRNDYFPAVFLGNRNERYIDVLSYIHHVQCTFYIVHTYILSIFNCLYEIYYRPFIFYVAIPLYLKIQYHKTLTYQYVLYNVSHFHIYWVYIETRLNIWALYHICTYTFYKIRTTKALSPPRPPHRA